MRRQVGPAGDRSRPTAAALRIALVLAAMIGAASAGMAAPRDNAPISSLTAQEIRHFRAPDAFQGVAVDDRAFYAIANTRITKYDKETGRKLQGWSDRSGDIIHLNSCAIRHALLFCAHSNYPDSPAANSIEIFDTATLKRVGHRSLGIASGWLTFADWHDGSWWLCYATYGGIGGTRSMDGSRSSIVEYDEWWQRRRTWSFPNSLLEAFGTMSASGGAWGSDGYLYVMGHDRPELYVLRLPRSGSVLRHVATIVVPGHGQAFGWDPARPRILYAIDRPRREVIVVRVPPVPKQGRPQPP